MSDEYENKTGYQAQSSETISSGGGGGSRTASDIDYVRPAEIEEQDLYHGHSFITKWVFCQDAKVIGVQYFLLATFTNSLIRDTPIILPLTSVSTTISSI